MKAGLLTLVLCALSASSAPPVRHFVNLSNGAEALPLLLVEKQLQLLVLIFKLVL